jgi:cell wall-associated NlpC family hydrolase
MASLRKFWDWLQTGGRVAGTVADADQVADLVSAELAQASADAAQGAEALCRMYWPAGLAFLGAAGVAASAPLTACLAIPLILAQLVTRRASAQAERQREQAFLKLANDVQALSQACQADDSREREKKAAEYILSLAGKAGVTEEAHVALAMLVQAQVQGLEDLITERLADVRGPLLAAMVDQSHSLPPDLASELQAQFAVDRHTADQSVASQLLQLLTQNEAAPEVRYPSPAGGEGPVARLRYNEAYLPFLYREKELGELQDFLQSEGPVAWWLWYGDGGQGKSRLALQLCRWAIANGWYAGFVQSDFPARIGNWDPVKPALLVVDYAALRAANVAAAIQRLANEPRTHPVRILLLDRLPLTYTWGEPLRSVEVKLSAVGPARYKEPRLLAPLGTEQDPVGEFLGVFEQAIRRQNRNLNSRERDKLRNQFAGEAFTLRGRRPLYALMAADAYLQEGMEGVERWTPEDLSEYVLKKEARVWGQHGVGQPDVNLVTYATLVGGLAEDRARQVRNSRSGFTDAGIMWVASHTEGGDRVPSLQPDPLGEGLIALRLTGELFTTDAANTDTVKEMAMDEVAAATNAETPQNEREKAAEYMARMAESWLAKPEVQAAMGSLPDDLKPLLQDAAAKVAVSGSATPEEQAAANEVVRGVPPALRLFAAVDAAQRLQAAYQWREATQLWKEAIVLARKLQQEESSAEAREQFAVVITDAVDHFLAHSVPGVLELLQEVAEVERSDPRERARNLVQRGRAEASESRHQDALSSFEESLTICRELASEIGNPQARRDLSVSLDNVAGSKAALGDLAGALKLYEESLTIARELASEIGNPQARRDLSVSLDNVAGSKAALGDLAGALELYEESLTIARELAREIGNPEARRDLSVSLDNVAGSKAALGDLAGALKLYEESLTIRRILAREIGNPEARRDLSVSLDNVAGSKAALGDLAGALKLYEESLTIARELASEIGNPQARRDLSVSLNNVAGSKAALGDLAGALKLYEESLTIRRILAREIGNPQARRDLSISLDNVAGSKAALGDLAGALKLSEESLGICRELAREIGNPQARRDLSVSLNNVAGSKAALGDLAGALKLSEESLGICRELAREIGNPQARRDLSVSLNNVAGSKAALGDLAGALKLYEESLTIRRILAREIGNPQARRDLSVSLTKLTLIAVHERDQKRACEHAREARTLIHALAAEFPAMPQCRQGKELIDNIIAELGCDSQNGNEIRET